jgi:hypothetical protein
MKKIILGFALLTISTGVFATTPGQTCRNSLMRYGSVPVSMFEKCKKANEYSAQAIDTYTQIYTGSMGQDMLVTLLKINDQDELECAISIAQKYDGSMTSKFLKRTCL